MLESVAKSIGHSLLQAAHLPPTGAILPRTRAEIRSWEERQRARIAANVPEFMSFRSLAFDKRCATLQLYVRFRKADAARAEAWADKLAAEIGCRVILVRRLCFDGVSNSFPAIADPDGVVRHDDPVRSALLTMGAVRRKAAYLRFKADSHRFGRADLRQLDVFSIDTHAGTPDIDDALSMQILPGGNTRVGLHIADVLPWIPAGDWADERARKQGFTYYGSNRMVPMLPARVGMGVASLLSGRDRLAWSLFIDLGSDGRVLDFDVCRSIIRNRREYDSATVERIIAGILHEPRGQTLQHLSALARLATSALGVDVGSDFDARNHGDRIVQSFALIGNHLMARWMEDHRAPLLYRVHPAPAAENVARLSALLENAGFHALIEGLPYQRQLSAMLAAAPHQHARGKIVALMRACLPAACYAVINAGHSALGLSHYCHFTSPIRRYPDLMLQRSVEAALNGWSTAAIEQEMQVLVDPLRSMERIADEKSQEIRRLETIAALQRYDTSILYDTMLRVSRGELRVYVRDMHLMGMLESDAHVVFDSASKQVTDARTGAVYRHGDAIPVIYTGFDLRSERPRFSLL